MKLFYHYIYVPKVNSIKKENKMKKNRGKIIKNDFDAAITSVIAILIITSNMEIYYSYLHVASPLLKIGLYDIHAMHTYVILTICSLLQSYESLFIVAVLALTFVFFTKKGVKRII